MDSNTYFATGSRKSAIAKVWLITGQNKHTVNGRPLPTYFGREDLTKIALSPLQVAGISNFGVKSVVAGGGLSAQAAAVALGIARALLHFNPELRGTLKAADLLKRDPREKERMKYGLAKRRKRFQWTKR
jgi:small subunit ribosomal protein S9|uniref:30S ribosomal protein S9 n=1 Tax=candidate division WOR-3 bacterium TaxID=2052148 RepID=A0A7V3V0B6_UNCW3